MRRSEIFIGFFVILLAMSLRSFAQDPGWPRKHVLPGGTLISYQPQVDEWKDHSKVTWRQAFQLTPTNGKTVIGAATLTGNTVVDKERHMVAVYGIQVIKTYFPSVDQATSARMDHLLRSFVPPSVTISLERVAAYLPKPQSVQTIQLNNTPPFIFASYSPAVLLGVDGEPVLGDSEYTIEICGEHPVANIP